MKQVFNLLDNELQKKFKECKAKYRASKNKYEQAYYEGIIEGLVQAGLILDKKLINENHA